MYITVIILIIGIVILFFLCIFFIYRSVRLESTLVSPSTLPVNAEFGVYPQTVGLSILDVCGTNNNEICTFTQVTSLENAIQICYTNANICSAFSYAPSNIPQTDGTFDGTMSIINFNLGTIASTSYDTYVQQIPVTIV